MQYIIKDGRGKVIQSRERFHNYTSVAREIMSLGAALPFTVWKHHTIHGTQSYDGERTQRLTSGVLMVKVQREVQREVQP